MTDPFAEYLQNPDRRRLSRFIVAYTEPVTRLVRRIVGCPEVSQDVVQDVFLRLAESELSPESVRYPRAYVLRAALNIAREHLREEKTRRRYESDAAKSKTTTSPPADEDLIAREAVERLYGNIDSLPEHLRVAIHLRAVDGLSYREIALVTDVSVGIVSSRIQEARRKLRQLLGGQQMAVAWANLELAREQGWFPLATDGLSRVGLARLKKGAKPARTMIAPAAATVAIVTLSALGVSTPWLLERPQEVSPRDEVATALGERQGFQVSSATPSVATSEGPEKPMAPDAPGAETETSEARGAETEAEGPAEPRPRENEGGEPMMSKKALLASAVVAMGMAGAASGAETGDADGDGRLTIADVIHLQSPLEAAEGSLAGFEEFPCYPESWRTYNVAAIIYLESLRRGVSGSLPHWDNVWPDDMTSEPLPEDDRATIELLPMSAPGALDDRALLHFRLAVTSPVRAFSVVLDAPPGLLEAPPTGDDDVPYLDISAWRRNGWVLSGDHHAFGDLLVAVRAQTYLITGGRYVVTYDLTNNDFFEDIDPGEYLVAVKARLSLHAQSGTYPIRVLPASEILFRDGTVARPAVLGESELMVENEVSEGLDDGVPPLDLDRENREVRGAVEFRLVDSEGNAPEPGEPLLEVFNDEEVTIRVQVRTQVPLNQLSYDLRWRMDDGLNVECTDPTVLFLRPDGTPYGHQLIRSGNRCGSTFGNGQAEAIFRLAGAENGKISNNRADRPLDYFRPLGAWLDLVELRLSVPDEVEGSREIQFAFQPDPRTLNQHAHVGFIPYGSLYPCNPDQWPDDSTYWNYNVVYHDGTIRVRGRGEPPAPPDLGIRFVLGTVSGAPGELVEVPLHAASSVLLKRMRVALELDPAILGVEGFEVDILDDRTGQIVRESMDRPGDVLYRVCDEAGGQIDPDSCTFGVPTVSWFRETEERYILLDFLPAPWNADGRLVEIGRLRLRIAEDAPPGETMLTPAAVPWVENGLEILVESGGTEEDGGSGGPYSPANEVVEGTVVIADRAARRDLIRGDANVDGGIDISDAVLMLNSLFTASRPLTCEDAADADDNGALNITDPILLLGVLFGGEGTLPPPSTCAPDPTVDTLGCEEECSAG